MPYSEYFLEPYFELRCISGCSWAFPRFCLQVSPARLTFLPISVFCRSRVTLLFPPPPPHPPHRLTVADRRCRASLYSLLCCRFFCGHVLFLFHLPPVIKLRISISPTPVWPFLLLPWLVINLQGLLYGLRDCQSSVWTGGLPSIGLIY